MARFILLTLTQMNKKNSTVNCEDAVANFDGRRADLRSDQKYVRCAYVKRSVVSLFFVDDGAFSIHTKPQLQAQGISLSLYLSISLPSWQ
jgi:hypothetical protein